ncbi:uncharacterized protein LOC106643138 isoform X2 [Copidosoma floridanum]|uniref:uncharacterized protein LOC106643138 isoform X2 n=1 Tax=Copidosoma floridanum TaxID=29053 RepID=UPI0006C94BEB|nr:uncharacterized protein LOC106643138 isoform X2 [Copidosoma floridanum]
MDTTLAHSKTDESELMSVRQKITEILEHKIILGKYTDKRYVESLGVYRDVIVIESPNDVDKLFEIKKLLEQFMVNRWIEDPQNISSQSCLLWTHLKEVPVGKHWFHLSGITIETKEILVEVKHVEPFRIPDRSFNISDTDFPSFDPKEIFTYSNVCEAFKFTVILFMALFTFFIEALKYLADLSIRFSYVMINFVHVSTPICMGIFEFLTKCVAGFYWLIYAMIKGSANSPAVPAALMSSQRAIGYGSTLKQHYANFRPNSHQDQFRYQRR